MSKNDQVEYCNVELRFTHLHVQNMIKDLICEGYSLYWSEDDSFFHLSIRTGRKLVKLRFQHMKNGEYKMTGDYMIKDPKLSEWLEKLIETTRGHAVVKRFKDHHMIVENILFGKVIRLVEVCRFKQRIIFQREPTPTIEEMDEMFASQEGEKRVRLQRIQVDQELEKLYGAMVNQDEETAKTCRERLKELSRQILMLEG